MTTPSRGIGNGTSETATTLAHRIPPKPGFFSVNQVWVRLRFGGIVHRGRFRFSDYPVALALREPGQPGRCRSDQARSFTGDGGLRRIMVGSVPITGGSDTIDGHNLAAAWTSGESGDEYFFQYRPVWSAGYSATKRGSVTRFALGCLAAQTGCVLARADASRNAFVQPPVPDPHYPLFFLP